MMPGDDGPVKLPTETNREKFDRLHWFVDECARYEPSELMRLAPTLSMLARQLAPLRWEDG